MHHLFKKKKNVSVSVAKLIISPFRSMERIRNIIQSSSSSSSISAPLPTTSCSICHKSPVAIPYQINCRHVYCYTCLRQALIDNPNYKCQTCGQPVSSSQRIIL